MLDALAELLKRIGGPVTNGASLALLIAAILLVRKLYKMPEQPLSEAAFKKWIKRELDPRLVQIENNQNSFSAKLAVVEKTANACWGALGISKPRMDRVVEPREPARVEYVEQIHDPAPARFRTGENPIYIPDTGRPPPPRMDNRARRDALIPRADADAVDPPIDPFPTDRPPPDDDGPDTPVTNPEGRHRRRR